MPIFEHNHLKPSNNKHDWTFVKYLNVLDHNRTHAAVNITNFLFWVLWICLVTSIKDNNANLQKLWCLSACKKMNSIPNFYVTISQTCYFEYFENAWPCPSIIIVQLCRKLRCSEYWSQLVASFHAYLHAKNQPQIISSFLRYCREIANLLFWVIWHACQTHLQ